MQLSRRELLTYLLGAPLAASLGEACDKPGVPELQGGFIEPSMKLGHRLRSAPPGDEAFASAPQRRVQVAIVGGGAAALSCARNLLAAGQKDLALLELEPRAGGTSVSGSDPVSAHPWGAHYITVPMAHNQPLIALLEEMGIVEGRDTHGRPQVDEQHLVREPKERLFYKGYWYPGLYRRVGATARDLAELQRFQTTIAELSALRDSKGRRAFAIPISSGSDDAAITELDSLSAAVWLKRENLSSPRLLELLDYGCRDDYGLGLEHTSAWAMLFYHASRVQGRHSSEVITWPEGNGALIQHMARGLGNRLHTGKLVLDVVPQQLGVDLHVLNGVDGSLERWHAERVVLAVPQFIALRLLRPLRHDPPARLGDFHYGAWLTANLHLSGRPGGRGYAPAWDNVLSGSPSLGYVSATHQRGRAHGPSIWTYYLPMADAQASAGRQRLLSPSWRQWSDAITSDLGRAHPDLAQHLRRLDVCRWGHGMIQPRPGFVWGRARRAARRPQGRVHFAHSDLSGVALFEEAFDQGLRAAAEVLAASGTPT